MATQFIREFGAFDGTNANLEDVFVYASIGSGKYDYVPLSNLRVYVNDTTRRRLNSIKDFQNVLAQQNRNGINILNVADSNNSNSIIIGSFVPNDAQLLTHNINVPDLYLSNNINGFKEDGSIDAVEYGLKRAVEIKKSEGFNNDDPYVYAELSGDNNMQFIRKDEIGYYEGSRFITLEDLINQNRDADILALIQEKDLYTRDNKYVTKLFTSSTCSIGAVKAREEIDVANLKLHSFTINSNGQIENVDTNIDSLYSEQFTRKEKDGVYLDIANYRVNRDNAGDFIKVRFKGYDVETLVSISYLHEINADGEPGPQIDKNEFLRNSKSYIGKSLVFVMTDPEVKMQTEPLTIEEVSLTFDSIKTMEVTEKEEDILKDGTYLRLKDGRYIEENKSVRPNCYEFLSFNETEFDAYFVLLEPTGENNGVIVNKDMFANKSAVNYNGKELKLINAVKIKLSNKPMNECDLIQTSSTNQDVESCELLNTLMLNTEGNIYYGDDGNFMRTEKTAEEKNRIINDANADFLEKYKNGQYVLDKVIDDEGNLVELDQQHNRYTMSSITTQKDAANELYEYQFFKDGKLVYNTQTGKLEGGPKYDFKSAIKKELTRGWANVLIGCASLLSLGGVFLLAVAPMAVAATIGALAVYPIGASIVHAIKGMVINHRKYKYKDRVEQNRKQFSKEINSDLNDLYEQTNETLKQSSYDRLKEYFKQEFLNSPDERLRNLKGRQLEKEIDKKIIELSEEDYKRLTYYARGQHYLAFLERMNKVEEKLSSLSTTKYYSEFKIENGKGEVTPENAPLFSKYRAEMQAMEKEIKRLRKAVKKDPSFQAELDMKLNEYHEKSMNYTSMGQELGRDAKYDTVSEKVYLMKGLIAYKEFGDIIDKETDAEEQMFTEDEKEFISHLEYNPEKNQFTYDGKVFSTKSVQQKILNKFGKGKKSTVDKVINSITSRLSTYGKSLPKYEYEEGTTLIRSKNNETDSVVPVEETVDSNVAPERTNDAERTAERQINEPVHETDRHVERGNEQVDDAPKPKSRLSVANLERLLKRIKELNRLDEMFFGPDEEMEADIEGKIEELEDLIREDLHLLKSAGRSKSERYAKYKRQIVSAEKMLKEHQIYNENRARINVSATI